MGLTYGVVSVQPWTDTLGIVALAGDTSLALGAPAPFTINLSPRDRG